ncbi:sensor histidine kinase [Merismopedia glauca]|uniref:histidine kinase n=1 Tax=Merismopedia glauca CCAP 1448/3 TaxID=1296344 RepID=A0A2T1C8K9_9CYAN|nr:HAMP domain-containing sensor histidine kinase [Merismopedia glauca]PSB04488.1 two-component sensor histidine kinase [Merismopedia glauca CCAP 1448/3]
MVDTRKLVLKSNLSAKTTVPIRLAQTKGLFWEARNRILAWYGLLMVGFIGLSVPIFSEIVFYQVDRRVRQDLAEEVETLEKFISTQVAQSREFTSEDLKEAFQEFFFNQIPEDDTFLISFVNGKFSRSSPRAKPDILQEDRELMLRWANLAERKEGEEIISDPKFGNIIYIATPIVIDSKVKGVFVIAHTTAGETREAQDVIFTVSQVLLVGLVSALALGWIASAQVLKPLRSLATTARSIGQSNLNHRIPIQSSGEIGELGITFNKMLDRLQNTFNSQKAFINNAGHELRTPIAIIRGHIELMGDDPQEQKETVELVIDELDRMTRMVEELMLLTKSERPDFLQLETIDINTFTQEIYTKATALAERQWKFDAQAVGIFVGDRQRLTQALINLIENATQYTTETDTIALGAILDRDFVRLWVRDTGIGIGEEDHQRVFERFARAANSRRCSDGCGLGLSIVQAIAQAHDGRVELFSKLGFGSTFSLVLPTEPLKN